ncbi:MAG: sodium-dependent transporter [Bacillota bacterium]
MAQGKEVQAYERPTWSARLGFVAGMMGWTIGLGTVWRFPYTAAMFGGGALLIPFFIAMVFCVIPGIIAEIGLGKYVQRGAPVAFGVLWGRVGQVLGWLLPIVTTSITGYYFVITGWSLKYAFLGLSPSTLLGRSPEELKAVWLATNSGVQAMLLALLVVVAGWAVMARELKKGLEAVCKVMVPLIFVFLGVMTVRSLTLPGAMEGVKYLFRPNIPTWEQFVQAVGMAFFTGGFGYGNMLIFGSYLKKRDDVVNSGVICILGDLSGCLLAALAMIPIFFATGATQHLGAGTTLAFISIPTVLSMTPGGQFILPLFFLSLFFAAFTSATAFSEVAVGALCDRFRISRRTSATIVYLVLATIAVPVAFRPVLVQVIDLSLGTLGYVLSGLIITVFVAYMWPGGLEKMRQRVINPYSDFKVGRWWTVLMWTTVPLIIVLTLYGGLVTQVIPFFSKLLGG